MSSQMLFGGLGVPELILVAAIVLLLAGARRLFAQKQSHGGESTPSRAYLDRLLGTARRGSRPASPKERPPGRERSLESMA